MKKIFSIIVAVIMAATVSMAQTKPFWGVVPSYKLPARNFHEVQELDSDICVDTMAWKALPKGLNTAFASTAISYAKKEVPARELNRTASTVVWRGERAYFQVLVWASNVMEQVRVLPSDLIDAKGNVIDKSNVTCELVRYVLSNYPYEGLAVDCGGGNYMDGFLVPDRFESFERFDLDGCTTRPVWVSVEIPRTTAAGEYKGTLEIRSKGGESSFLEMTIKVQDHILPLPQDWNYRLDLWQNPWAVAWYNNVEPWSEEHMLLLKKHLELYADAGGTFVTTYCVHSPWSDNSYMIEGGMVEWIRNADSSWTFDYSIFDKYVTLAQSCGLNKAITIYSPLPWANKFRYLDAVSGDYVTVFWAPDSQEFKDVWNVFLTDLMKHLKSKGWFEKTYIGINENGFEETFAAADFVKKHDPSWKTTYAGGWNKDLEYLFDDFCSLYGTEPSDEEIRNRASNGRTSTYYVCCNPAVPNDFVFSPPEQGRWISWYAKARGYDGFLRWAYDAWPEDVKRDARHAIWPAGDCFLVYPGAKSCIRFEKLREGIIDYVKVDIILKKASCVKDKSVSKLVQELEKELSIIAAEKEFSESSVNSSLKRADSIVDQLSDILK
ncbi:MAG: DUF4091 domain-containing protein [Bacteroidales bacterium]|nr:DUF4091 domain-containing protein [Bacteroidales bacterium]